MPKTNPRQARKQNRKQKEQKASLKGLTDDIPELYKKGVLGTQAEDTKSTRGWGESTPAKGTATFGLGAGPGGSPTKSTRAWNEWLPRVGDEDRTLWDDFYVKVRDEYLSKRNTYKWNKFPDGLVTFTNDKRLMQQVERIELTWREPMFTGMLEDFCENYDINRKAFPYIDPKMRDRWFALVDKAMHYKLKLRELSGLPRLEREQVQEEFMENAAKAAHIMNCKIGYELQAYLLFEKQLTANGVKDLVKSARYPCRCR